MNDTCAPIRFICAALLVVTDYGREFEFAAAAGTDELEEIIVTAQKARTRDCRMFPHRRHGGHQAS